MIKEVKTSTLKVTLIALVSLVLSACVPSVGGKTSRTRDTSNAIAGSANVNLYEGRILADNPIILSKNAELSDSYDLNKLLSTAFITENPFLQGSSPLNELSLPIRKDYVFKVLEIQGAPSPLQTANGKWSYNANSVEFLQVNTFYHLNLLSDLFFTNFDQSFVLSRELANTSIPSDLRAKTLLTDPLIAWANCDEPNNSYFNHTNLTMCFGYTSTNPNVRWAQDSTVIYHETGHFFQKLQLNLRNNIVGPKVDMGNLNYDEAGAIGEGLSDYYSYYVNGRTHFAEWAAGRFLHASRPMSERDPLHVAGLSTDADQRLSYPQFLDYNPNDPTIPVEEVHFSGMIVSHYLVALTEDLQDKCLITRKDASGLVIRLLTETLAELGDLSSTGTTPKGLANGTAGKINLSAVYSTDWYRLVNPITYRSFMQTFAKNLLKNLTDPTLNRCNGGIYPKDQIESLIDQYGLLLFRTYNENRSLLTGTNNTGVTATNRKKSVLISKNLLILDPTSSASAAYILDNPTQIKDALAALSGSGLMVGSPPTEVTGSLSSQVDIGFDNNNGRMSPGEIVAVAINLYNNSNSPMGGIQILANDWNHADASGKPCRFSTAMSSDAWPLIAEGGADCGDTTYASSDAHFAPVCFMQYNGTSGTSWVSQNEFASKMALDTSFCLDPKKPNECFIRAIKGADQAHYSKMNAKSTWGQTMADPVSGKAPGLSGGNVILFEVSKQIPPGTVVDCRLRARFTNCEDCYHDTTRNNYDYTDTDYNGPRPYKIIHLQIPIID